MKKLFLAAAAIAARVFPAPIKRAIYQSGPLARLLRRMLNRAAPTGQVPVKIAGGDLAGQTLVLDMQLEKDYWLGTYEPELQSALRKWVVPGMVAYDVGANIGYVTLLLALATGENGRVYAFEALPENFRRLQSNIEINNLDSRVAVFSSAVVDVSRSVKFHVHPSGGMGKADGSAGREEKYSAEILVPGIALDDFVYHMGYPVPQVVKLDIEGGEVLALPGMERLLKEAQPLMLIELHGYEAARVAWGILTAAGYKFYRMTQDFPAIQSLEALDWKAYVVARAG